MTTTIGFAPDEIMTGESTRSARLKWVVVVNEALPPGLAVNAAVCAAAATTAQVSGLLGHAVNDADGHEHPGLPWTGCTVLVADAATIHSIRAKAAAHEETFVADMTASAQQTRVYDEWASSIAGSTSDQIEYYAISIVGPRNRVDRLVSRLSLMP